MLGKLFGLGPGQGSGSSISAQAAQSKSVPPLASVQEDIHTRNLLFPDPQDLYENRQHQLFQLSNRSTLPPGSSASAFDYSGDVELEARDVRVVIMQDALASVSASLLYDSQAPPPMPVSSADRPSIAAGTQHVSPQESRRIPVSPRKPTQGSQRTSTAPADGGQSRQSAFDRRPSVQSRYQPIPAESDSQRTWREYREELATLSSCIFGNSELMAYKGTSTKVHLIPCDPRSSEHSGSASADGRGSLGMSSLRSSRLSQSVTSENMAPPRMPSAMTNGNHDRKKVLITRLFPVTIPPDEEAFVLTPGRFSDDVAGYPFPADDDLQLKKKKPQVKQKRTPMYAVALVITLPPQAPLHSTHGTSRSAFRGSSSFTEQNSFPSSLTSLKWGQPGTLGHQAYGMIDWLSTPDDDDRMESLTQHWDVIMRTLTRLQSVVSSTLFTMLKQADLASPDPFPGSMNSVSAQLARSCSAAARQPRDGLAVKPPKTNAKIITLFPNCLHEHRKVILEVDAGRNRIVSGIRASRVIAGQNRWPMWREEARCVAKWAGGRDQRFFLHHLLTGFLATHIDWLQALSPPPYRCRRCAQVAGKGDEDTSIAARTIIVAPDKISARRLIFLLSAFLPASQQLISMRAHRQSTSVSTRNFSASPPSFVVPILKEESLRRKINRRTGPRRAFHSRTASMQSQHARSAGIPASVAHLGMEGPGERRASDAVSIRTMNLPIPGADWTARKSSSATTATVTAETSTAHFALGQRAENHHFERPGSSSSMAAKDLKRLAKEDSEGVAKTDAKQSSSRWSVISGLWNARQRDATPTSNMHSRVSSSTWASVPSSPIRSTSGKTGSISEAARKPVPSPGNGGCVAAGDGASQSQFQPETRAAGRRQPSLDENVPPEETVDSQKSQPAPEPVGAFDSPVPTSINVDDGIIDVNIPFSDYLASYETAVSSPSSSGYLSTPGFSTMFDAFEQSCRVAVDGDSPLNVAGWLPSFHPDFVLQAVPPGQKSLIEEVKNAMRNEPFSAATHRGGYDDSDDDDDRWVDVSDAIIADTTNFTVRRIRYRRFVRLRPANPPVDQSKPESPQLPHPTESPLVTPSTQSLEARMEENFIEESIVALEQVFTDAVERVLAVGSSTGGSSTGVGTGVDSDQPENGSAGSSRSASKRRGRRQSETIAPEELVPLDDAQSHQDNQDKQQQQHHGSQAATKGRALAATARGTSEVPRSECKTVILSALEEVVRQVLDEHDPLAAGEQGADATRSGSDGNERGSVLRQAVRSWLTKVAAAE